MCTMKTTALKFRQATGLTVYAMSCGYVQRAKRVIGADYELRIDLFLDGGPQVRVHEHGGKGRICWETFESLSAARKFWAAKVLEHFGPRIKAAKADRRYSVNREHTGERDQYYVARIEGAARGSWIGKSETEAGAWLLVADHKGALPSELGANS